MNVKELIEELNKLDQYALVCYDTSDLCQSSDRYVRKVYENGQGKVILNDKH